MKQNQCKGEYSIDHSHDGVNVVELPEFILFTLSGLNFVYSIGWLAGSLNFSKI